MQLVFVRLRHKSASPLIFEFILSTIFCFFLYRFLIIMYFYHLPAHDKSETEFYYIETMNHITGYQDALGLNTTFAVQIVIFCIRSTYLLKASRTFGPMIETIFQMLKEFMKFILLETFITFIFLISMRVMFYKLDEFSNEKNTFLTLFMGTFGIYDFSIFRSEKMTLHPWYGYGTMILYICISGVILINLLIAIISNVYSKLSKIKIGLYLKTLIDIRQGLQDDSRYSCLVSGVVPFNFPVFL